MLIGCLFELVACGGERNSSPSPNLVDSSADGGAVGGSSAGGTSADGTSSGIGGSGAGAPGAANVSSTVAGNTMNTSGPSTSGTSATTGSVGEPPVKVVRPCNTDPESVGVWENITPPGVGRTAFFAMNPLDTATLYLATGGDGLFKTTDCGASWVRIDDGKSQVEGGDNNAISWGIVIDPVNPDTIYMNNGYGPKGVFKSVDGGVSWKQIIPTDVFIYNGFVSVIAMDPTNHLHLTVSPHFSCVDPYPENCMLQSFDGGENWTVLEGTPGASEGSGQVMIDSQTWYWTNVMDGLWITANAGESWSKVSDTGAQTPLLRAANDTFFVTSLYGPLFSADGTTWEKLTDGAPCSGLAEGNGAIYVARESRNSFSKATMRDAASGWDWTELDPPTDRGAWKIDYDKDHDILYSTHLEDGFHRMVTSAPKAD